VESQPPASCPAGGFPRRLFWLLFTASLVLRLLVLGLNAHHAHPFFFEPDSTDYLRDAADLSRGMGLRDLQGAPSMRRPPGYSAVLALLFAGGLASPSAPIGAILLQMILSALTVPLAARIAFILGGARAALVAGILLALEPSAIASSDLIMSETLYTFALVGAFALWSRWWLHPSGASLTLLACLIGALPLIRPAGTYLPFLFTLLILGWGPPGIKAVRAALVFLLLSLAPLAVWKTRNYVLLESTEVSSIGPWVQAMFARSVQEMAGETPPPAAPWSQDFAREQELTGAQAMEIQSAYFRRTVQSHPLLAARRFLLNAAVMVGVPNDRLVILTSEHPPPLMGGSIEARLAWLRRTGPFALLLVLGMAISLGGIVCLPWLVRRARSWDPHRQSLAFAAAGVVVYQWGIASLIQYQADRYRIPMMPLLAVALAVVVLGAASRKGRWAAAAAGRSSGGLREDGSEGVRQSALAIAAGQLLGVVFEPAKIHVDPLADVPRVQDRVARAGIALRRYA